MDTIARDDIIKDIHFALEDLGHIQSFPLIELKTDMNSKETLARYGLCLSLEVAEFIEATPWKLWKTYGDGDNEVPIDREAMIEEMADILLYIGTWVKLLEQFNIHVVDIAEAVMSKYDKVSANDNYRLGEKPYDDAVMIAEKDDQEDFPTTEEIASRRLSRGPQDIYKEDPTLIQMNEEGMETMIKGDFPMHDPYMRRMHRGIHGEERPQLTEEQRAEIKISRGE